MSTLALTNSLAPVFVTLGIVGAAVAVLSAVVAGIALTRGAAGLAGGAAGIWIFGALLSVAASFSSVWAPLIAAVSALAIALVLGSLLRAATSPLQASGDSGTQEAPATGATIVAAGSRPVTLNTEAVATA